MNPNQLLTHFDRLADAPDAVRRLRRFILDLAVRGKLVEQDPKDEPAAELLRRIHAEKARLVKGRTVRQGKPLPAQVEGQLPFIVPSNWLWSQLAEIGFINPRNSAADEQPASFMPMTLLSAEYGVVSKHEVRPWGEIKNGFTHFANGDVVLAKITPCFQNGKSTILRDLTGGIGAGTTELHVVRPVFISPEYVLIFLKSPHFIELGTPRMTGTAGQKRVATEYFANSPFPLPPLAEQRRIVAKVDELMTLCDRLEAAQAERENRRDRLVRSSLHRLNQPADGPAFRDDARFTLDHLPRLAARPEHVPQLRQTILNLAVRGKLVPQEPNEESGQELLARIRAANGERSKLRDGDEASTNLAKIEEFGELPKTWVWTRLREIADISAGSTPSRDNLAYWHGGKVPWVASGATSESIIMEASEYVTEEGARAHRLRLYPPGTLLVALYGQGKTRGQVATLGISATINQACAAICSFPGFEELLSYVKLILLENYDRVRLNSAGGPQPNLNGQKIKEVLVPLPPLAEQRRIVAKVDELMAVCDRLEAQLTTAQAVRRRLLESVLHEALASPRL
jgi:type I restriction enzyme S subunit